MANGKAGVDPRYAAQFQRGFEGGIVESPSAPERIAPAHLSGGRAASAERVVDRVVVASRPRTAVVEDADVPEDPSIGPSVWPERALFAAAVVLALVSIVFLVQAASTLSDGSSLVDLGSQLLAWAQESLPGPLLVGGVVAICGGFVVGALRTRRD